MSASLLVHMLADVDSLASSLGIEARYSGRCGLCGKPVAIGDRIYQLPRRRTGAQGRWVCLACRWPDKDRVIDAEHLICKASHRLRVGPTLTPNLQEVAAVLSLLEGLTMQTADEVAVAEALEAAQALRRPPIFGRVKTAVLLSLLKRSVAGQ